LDLAFYLHKYGTIHLLVLIYSYYRE